MFLVGAALADPTVVLAQSLQRELVYQIAYGNVMLGVATVELSAGGPDYRIRLLSWSDGPIRVFARWRNEGETTGRRVTGALHLLHHERRGDWGGDRSFLRMTVDGEGAVDISSDPPEEPAKTALLLERAGPLLLDPYSAVLALLYEIERSRTCQGAVRAFDGRRLTDVELVVSTAGDLPHDRPWAYQGKTRACRLVTRPVSVDGQDKRKGRELKIWLTTETAPLPIPVRIELPLLLGRIVARLVPDRQ